ncbi:MAG: NADH-quinone oxidoreductase subunit K [Chloroflexi bacterium]|nr:NADH-quinone oxidoreductase subunit K [Chloroflexota bacterium]
MNVIFAVVTGILFGLGVFQLLRRDLVKVAMGFYILFTAINLFFLAVGAYNGETAAYVVPRKVTTLAEAVPQGVPSDPLVQALLLTAIVISFGSYALLLGMLNVVAQRNKSLNTDRMNNLVR